MLFHNSPGSREPMVLVRHEGKFKDAALREMAARGQEVFQ